MPRTGSRSSRVRKCCRGRSMNSSQRRRSCASAHRLACARTQHRATPRVPRPCPPLTLPTTHPRLCPRSRCAAAPLPGSNSSASLRFMLTHKAMALLPEGRRPLLRVGMPRLPAVCPPHPLVDPALRLLYPHPPQPHARPVLGLRINNNRCKLRLGGRRPSRPWASRQERQRIRSVSSCETTAVELQLRIARNTLLCRVFIAIHLLV